MVVTHSLFVDDTFLFRLASVKEAKNIKSILDLYTKLSGHKINVAKSKVFMFFINVDIVRKFCKILDFE